MKIIKKTFVVLSVMLVFSIPTLSFAETVCRVNGRIAECPAFLQYFAPFMWALNLIILALIVFMVASQWIVFKKAGKPGWTVLIPVYNLVVLLEITNRPIWWIILMFIPFVNFIVSIILLNDLAKSFGKGTGFTVGLFFLSFIFLPILAFGKSQYTKPIRVGV